MLRVAAVDLGAESGRVAAVDFDGERLRLDVVQRFDTATVGSRGSRWDLPRLRRDVLGGLAALDRGERPVAAVGVDSWGVDYVLVGPDGGMVDAPYCYRDPRTSDPFAEAMATLGEELLYAATGTQLLPINTVFGLLSDATVEPGRLARADRLLLIADYVHLVLSGVAVGERTLASTTGLYDTRRGGWAADLVDRLGLPGRLLPELVDPGTVLGPVRRELGLCAGAQVVVPCAHDTASAAAAVPYGLGEMPDSLFISSGSWSLVGREHTSAAVTDEARVAGLTNEAGFGGAVLVMRNVAGLWLLQACRRQWAQEGQPLSYAEIADLAAAQSPLVSIVDPDATDFLAPGDMPRRIQDRCRRTGQPVPLSVGQVARTVIDSLALRYQRTCADLTAVLGRPVNAVRVVGGGALHRGLAQATADATGLPVHCGPVEATALGNAGVQLIALGELAGLDDLRALLAAEPVLTFTPADTERWRVAAAGGWPQPDPAASSAGSPGEDHR